MFRSSGTLKFIAEICKSKVRTKEVSFDSMSRYFNLGDSFAFHSNHIDVVSSELYVRFVKPIVASIPVDKFLFAFVRYRILNAQWRH